MMVAISVAILVTAGNPSDGEQEQAALRQAEDVSIDCGPRSLYLLLRLEGREAELDNIISRLSLGKHGEISMQDLREVAGTFGLTLTGVRLGPTNLNLDRPAILHLNQAPHDHFVVVRPIGHTGKLIQVLDPNRPPEVWDKSRLLNAFEWSGLALIPSRPNRRLMIIIICGLVVAVGCFGLMALRASKLGRVDSDSQTPKANSFQTPMTSQL